MTYAWTPTADQVERARVRGLMQAHEIATLPELRRRSVQDIGWFWDAVARDLEIPFSTPYRRVYDDRGGLPWTRWFDDGRINLAAACVDRWRVHRREAVALVAEEEDGTVRRLSFGELAEQVDIVAAALRRESIRPGDTVAVFMPMVVEAVIAAYAVAKVGAIYLPIFSGFGPAAVAARLADARARLVFTADAAARRGSRIPMKEVCDQAVARAPSVRRVVVLDRFGTRSRALKHDGVTWSSFIAGVDAAEGRAAHDTASEDAVMLTYTSGTTGRPKGAVHVHGGLLVKLASECAYHTDVGPDDLLFWLTDMGWIMGQWSVFGAHANGAAVLLYEGAPDYPTPDRIWATVARESVSVLGVSPTLIRALKVHGEQQVSKHDLRSLRILASTGEPWNPAPYTWLSEVVGKGRLPIINMSGGTEVGGCFLSPYPVEPIRACSVGGISLGMDMDVFDPRGRSTYGTIGELVCRQPWPAMTRGVWGDTDRFLRSYFSMYPDVWRHGDWTRVDDDGQWFVLGRSDEAINVAGNRLGPAEVESVLTADPEVAEAATVGVPDDTRGEAVWCFWVPTDSDGPDVSDRLTASVANALGRPFKPARVVRVMELPRTRSAKIMRRTVRAIAVGDDPGDLSAAENPDSVECIRVALDAHIRASAQVTLAT